MMPNDPHSQNVPNALPEGLRGLRFDKITRLRDPLARTLGLLPLVAVVLLASQLAFGLRRDAVTLGWALGWGASVLQAALGLLCIALALRESVPGRALPRWTVTLGIGLAALAVTVTSVASWHVSPIAPEGPGVPLYVARICILGTFTGAAPLLLLGLWMSLRAFPLRPALAGFLVGLGAGLVSDSGWRLFCHYSNPAHLLASHIAPAVLCGVLASLAALGLARSRRVA